MVIDGQACGLECSPACSEDLAKRLMTERQIVHRSRRSFACRLVALCRSPANDSREGPGLRPQANSGMHLPIVRLLDIPVNRVLEWTLGPGLDNSIVGLGPQGAWIALCH